jgi:cytoskeletal protein RodZ
MEAGADMDVGKTLQDARIAKNLSLDMAAQETNIRKSYLEAIEQNDFALLHGDVFVKGVMRTYGNYLGLDGAQLVEEYKAASRGNGPVKNNNTIRESRNVKVRPTFKSNRDVGSGNGNDRRALFIIVGIAAVLFAVAGGIYFYLTQKGQDINSLLPFRFGIGNEVKEQDKKAAEEPGTILSSSQGTNNISEGKANAVNAKEKQTDEKKKEDAVKPSVKVEEKNISSEESTKINSVKEDAETKMVAPDLNTTPGNGVTELKIASQGKCWLRVTDQKGTVLFEGNLLKGESKVFSSSSNIIMRIGNLKDLTIEHNGKILPFEETYEPVTRIYTPKEVQ